MRCSNLLPTWCAWALHICACFWGPAYLLLDFPLFCIFTPVDYSIMIYMVYPRYGSRNPLYYL